MARTRSGADQNRPPSMAVDPAATQPRKERARKRQRDGEQAEVERAWLRQPVCAPWATRSG